MKRIPCRGCGAQNIGPKTAKHPNGAPVIFGYWSCGDGLAVIKCFRCGSAHKLGAADFNRLPSLTEEDRAALGLQDPPVPVQAQSGTTPSEVNNA